MKKNKSQKDYIEYLNGIYSASDLLENDNFIYLLRSSHDRKLAASGLYGSLLKKNDPIAFNVGFGEWKQFSN